MRLLRDSRRGRTLRPGDPSVSAHDGRPANRRRRLLIAGLIAFGVVMLIASAVILPLVATSTANFFSRYHLLNRRYVNLENSAHEGVGCRDCHETQPLENGVALVGDFYRSLVTSEPLPAYFVFQPPRREACLKCHEDDWAYVAERTERIPHPAHTRVASETRNCVDCHKWTAHFETYMTKHKEMPFSGVCVSYGCHVGTKQTEQCYNCHHVLHESADEWKTKHPEVVKETGKAACTEQCHTVEQCQECHTTGKTPKFTGRPIEISMKSIEQLHVKPEWTSRYHGSEAIKDVSRCMKCHQSEGECDECHLQRPAFHGSTDTWIGRHSKRAKSVTDPRCIACHDKAWCEACHQQFKEME